MKIKILFLSSPSQYCPPRYLASQQKSPSTHTHSQCPKLNAYPDLFTFLLFSQLSSSCPLMLFFIREGKTQQRERDFPSFALFCVCHFSSLFFFSFLFVSKNRKRQKKINSIRLCNDYITVFLFLLFTEKMAYLGRH